VRSRPVKSALHFHAMPTPGAEAAEQGRESCNPYKAQSDREHRQSLHFAAVSIIGSAAPCANSCTGIVFDGIAHCFAKPPAMTNPTTYDANGMLTGAWRRIGQA
jgi:hypothetical protein